MLNSLGFIAKINRRLVQYKAIEEKYGMLMISSDEPNISNNKHEENFSVVTETDAVEVPPCSNIVLQTIAFLILIIQSNTHYNICSFMPQNMGSDNIYLAASFLSIGELIAALISTPLSFAVKRKKLFITNASVQFCFALVLLGLTITEYRDNVFSKIIQSVLSIVFKIIVCININILFTYGAELFTTKYRANVLAAALLLGGMSMSIVPYLMGFARHWNIHPLATGIPLTIAALLSAVYLPETLNANVSN